MSNRKTWKSVGALLLTVAMLAGMLSVMGALPATAKTTTAMKFTADFSELSRIVTDNGGTFTDGMYRAPYTPASDTTSLEGKFNTWANGKFYTYQTYGGAVRAYFGQDSNNLQTYLDDWSGNQYLAAGEDGYLQFYAQLKSGQMLRKGITLSPLYNGAPAKLKNFEASLTFRFTTHEGNSGNAVVFNFHETQAAYMDQYGDFKALSSGNTVVLGNGDGNYKAPGIEGLAFYQKGDTISATSVADEGNLNSANANEVVIGDRGARFTEAMELNRDYTLAVRALNGTATITVTDTATGNEVYTVAKAYETTDGYVSFGFFNAPFKVKSFEVAELDNSGALVDFGTYAASLTDGIERFTASFDNMKDVIYKGGKYYYSANHDADRFSDDKHKAMTQGGSTYAVNMNDSALVEYLESKFAFYYQQEGHFFRRQKVNGLYVDDKGNQFTKGSVAPGTTIYKPDTKEVKGSPQWIDYIGTNATGKTHFWELSDNKFFAPSSTGLGDGMYRYDDTMTVKNTDGTLAQLENFELEADVSLRPDKDFDYANLTVQFRSPSPFIHRGNVDTAAFTLSPNGGYIVGGGDGELKLTSGYIYNKDTKAYDAWSSEKAVDFTKQTEKNATTDKRAGIYAKTTGVNLGTSEYHLKLRVVGKNVTATVTDTAGNVKFTINETTSYAGSGYLSLGGSNNATRWGNIVITRLDKDGNAVDFSDANDGYAYGASFGNLAEYRVGNYYRNSGADLFYLSGAGNPFDFSDETKATDKAVCEYLREKFDFYATKEGSFAKLENPYTNTKDSGLYASDGAHHGQWKLRAGRCLTATFSGGGSGNDGLLRKTMSLVPKMNGAAVQTANFETEFDVNFGLNPSSIHGNEVGVLLSFRSDEAGRPAEGYHTVANNKDAILIHPLGVGIYDGVAADYSYSYANGSNATCVKQSDGSYCDEFTPYNNGGEKANSVHVYARLVGNQLTVQVTELGTETVLFEVTKTVNRMTAGYLYYSVCSAEVGLADLRLNLLDRDGNKRDAEDTANEGYAGIAVSGVALRAAGGWTGKYPGGNHYIDVGLAKQHGVFDSIKAYLNSRYDLYYQNQAELVKHASVFGNDAGDKGWYSHSLYLQWVQFNRNGLSLNSDPTALEHTAALVPKTADGAQMKGDNCIADMQFRFDNTDAAALFGFRMAEAGRFTDDAWNPVKNASFLKVTLSGVTLYDKGVETKLVDYAYTPAGNLIMGLHVEVIGDKLTGYVTKGSDTHNFSATLTNMDAGYFAQGFGDKAPNIFPMTIQVGGLNIGKAEEVAGGKLTVTRTASDKEGYHAWKVTVNKDAGEQLKPNTLVGTDAADGSTLYPTRVGFQSGNHNADSFIFYSKGDATFTADFYTPHTAADISMPCLGTSVNETKAGLRFINRINLYTAADGKVYTDIDGVPTEVADYGVMVATKAVLGEQELTYELAQGTNRIVRRSVLEANKYFDYSTDYVDIAVQITGLDQNGDLEICSRVYLKLANGTILYSDMATRTYNQAKA